MSKINDDFIIQCKGISLDVPTEIDENVLRDILEQTLSKRAEEIWRIFSNNLVEEFRKNGVKYGDSNYTAFVLDEDNEIRYEIIYKYTVSPIDNNIAA